MHIMVLKLVPRFQPGSYASKMQCLFRKYFLQIVSNSFRFQLKFDSSSKWIKTNKKGLWWIPRHPETRKGVASDEMLRDVKNKHRSGDS
ncbi:hypothetical protein PVAP13_8NG057701 [Panicum virgatum]|uniref:Uncharacterized protein n=1 Tax=Panicum virgatum TaxID=38727 RepID=A0A8T0P9Y1_PANVG|nr:hypothetical protein PVAP13_8NG057701 [Panicum virgatum]